jgi:hypothetical protein
VQVGKKADADDDRPPICPACGVTMGITIDEDGSTRYVCLECGFSDDSSKGSELRVSDLPPRCQDAGVRRSRVVSWVAHPTWVSVAVPKTATAVQNAPRATSDREGHQ